MRLLDGKHGQPQLLLCAVKQWKPSRRQAELSILRAPDILVGAVPLPRPGCFRLWSHPGCWSLLCCACPLALRCRLSPALTLQLEPCRWRAYFTSGSSAIYLFLYSMFYFWTKLDITRVVPMLMYFGYMAMVSYAFFILTGTIGFYSCYIFCR